MKTKIFTLILAFSALLITSKVNAQEFADGTSITTITTPIVTEMNIAAKIPVLSNFIADVKNDAVKISWIVKSEPINSVYYVEKSYDEVNYVVVGTIQAKYSPSNVNEYSFTDPESSNHSVYYSVRQESNIGSLYSKILSVQIVTAGL
jgi:hypothetical protein